MKKNKKRFIAAILLSALMGSMTTSYAAEPNKIDSKPSVVKIESFYSDGIVPQNNDTFELKYQKTGTNDIREMLIDSSKADGSQEINIEPGDYSITNIKYKGYNSEIEISGYAIVGSFHVEKNAPGVISLAIGEVEGRKLVENYAHVLSVQNGAYVDGFSTEEDEEIEPLELPDNIPDDPSLEAPEVNQSETEITDSSAENKKTESSQKTEQAEKSEKVEKSESDESKIPKFDLQSFLIRTGPLIITAIIIGIFIFIMHKKGKI